MNPTPREQQIAELKQQVAELKQISEIAGAVYDIIGGAIDELRNLMQAFDNAHGQYEKAVAELHVLLNGIWDLHPEPVQRYLDRRAEEAAAVTPPEPGGEHDDT
jgi:ABC-type transporter Mla subunit MlaD